MKNYLSINGKKTELTREQLKQLGLADAAKPTWEDFGAISGWFVSTSSSIVEYGKIELVDIKLEENKNLFPTMEEAEACLALSQLCQWRDKYNNGWKPNWEDDQLKFYIEISLDKIVVSATFRTRTVLAFKSAEIRDKFLEDFSELIETAKPLL